MPRGRPIEPHFRPRGRRRANSFAGFPEECAELPETKIHNKGRNMATSLEARLETGARIAEYFQNTGDCSGWRWRRCAERCFGLKCTPAVRERLRRAHQEWLTHSGNGAFTIAGAGLKQRGRMRRDAACPKPRKMACLWFEVLQWFVDEIESLRNRADSALVLKQARVIRDRLLDQGHEAAMLPKVDKHFLFRWRKEFGINVRKTTVRFKARRAYTCTYTCTYMYVRMHVYMYIQM